MLQSACLVFNLHVITADIFAALLNCTPVDRASDFIMARPEAIHFSLLGAELFRLLLGLPEISRDGRPGISISHATRRIC